MKLLLAVMALFVVSLCGSMTLIPTPTIRPTDPPCDGNHVTTQLIEDNPSWNLLGITVGDSTETDVKALYGEPTDTWYRLVGDQLQSCVYVYGDGGDRPLEFWISDGKVIAVDVWPLADFSDTNSLPPRNFPELKERYGRPDIVGWTFASGLRSAVWPDKGVQALLSSSSSGPVVSRLLYFSPLVSISFDQSLWATLVFRTNPHTFDNGDVIDNGPADPFDWSISPHQ